MKCRFCGYESGEDFSFCPSCGNAVTDGKDELCVEREEPSGASAVYRILNLLKDNLFLVLCICLSVGTGAGLIGGNLNVINVLASVFLWLVFAQVQKNNVDATQLKNVSGTVYASYIINNVACVIIGICGTVCGVVLAMFGGEVAEELLIYTEFNDENMIDIISESAVLFGVIIVVASIITATVMWMINFFGTRSIHKFAKSLYKSVESDKLSLVKCRAAHNWLMVFGIFSVISAVSSLTDFYIIGVVQSVGMAAAEIIAAMLINRYLSDCE